MAGHVHAELMMQYAEDAKTHEQPYLLWERTEHDGNWIELTGHPCWYSDTEYRRKPKTININGFDVELGASNPLECNQSYFTPDITNDDLYSEYVWMNDNFDQIYLKRHMIYLTKEAAIAHAKALLSFTEVNG